MAKDDKAHDRLAGKHPTPLSPKGNGRFNPLSSIASSSKGDDDDKKKAAMLAAFKKKGR